MAMKRIPKPIGPRVLIRLKPTEVVVSQGGIIIQTESQTTRAKFATVEAYVVDISETAWAEYGDKKPDVKVGDLVKVVKYSGDDDLTIEDDQIYRIINEVDIVCNMQGEGLNG